jgi:hypothetical protein
MTNEEARNILLTSVHPQTAEEAEAIGIAVKAVEKMIPKKLIRIDCGGILDVKCPNCGKIIGNRYNFLASKPTRRYNKDFCADCGQAIDWSEEHE